jgi:hypothetical protein
MTDPNYWLAGVAVLLPLAALVAVLCIWFAFETLSYKHYDITCYYLGVALLHLIIVVIGLALLW